MAVEVKVHVETVFDVSANLETAFALFSDVPRSIGHFPDVENLIDRGDNVFEWVMKSKGPKGFEHAVRYACRYTSTKVDHTVIWTPVDGVGNAVFSGSWKLKEQGTGTRVHFETKATMHIPAPRIMRSAVAPYAEKALRGEIALYHENLEATLNA